jgi:hypothetical protein
MPGRGPSEDELVTRKAVGFPHIGRQSREPNRQSSIKHRSFGVSSVATTHKRDVPSPHKL